MPATGSIPSNERAATGPGRQAFLDAMAQLAMSVSVVTTDGPYGRDGVAVSSMTPVSADTPLPTLLICLHQAGRVPDKLLGNGVFCINLLADDQHHIAERFAGRSELPHEDWFVAQDWGRAKTGSPALGDALVRFDCEVAQSSLVGTHHIIFGAVRAIHIRPEGRPLVHAQRGFHRLFDQKDPT